MNNMSHTESLGLPLEVPIKYQDGIPELKILPQGNWIDLVAADTWAYYAGDFMLMSLGVAMELPEGYEAILAARSSLFKNHGVILTNGIGVIDESYNGDNDIWKASLYALKDGIISKGDRICQFRIIPKMNLDPNSRYALYFAFKKVDSLGNKDRGGFGSTGV